MNKFVLVVCGVLLCFRAALAHADLFKADTFTLSNGLECVVIQNHKAPIVKHMLWYKAGAVDEAPGKGGSAHLLEHLMFRGTEKVKDGEFNRILNENGADSNAFTSYDVTAYHQFADISRLEVLMALEADRMQNLSFDEKAFKAEQKIVFQERKQVVENNPASAFNERFNLILRGNSAYGRPITGLNEEIMALTYADVRDFYERYYAPNNAVLVLSGDIDAETAKKLAQKYYGGISAREVERKKPEINDEKFAETLTMRVPEIKTAKLVYEYLLPNYAQLKGRFYDYLVLAEYLGGSNISVLYRDLVVAQKAAAGLSVDYSFVSRGNSVFSISVVPAEGVSAEKMQVLLEAALQKAFAEMTPELLEKTKRKMIADLAYINDNPSDAAYLVGYMLANGFGLDEVQKYEDGIVAVTFSEAAAAFKEVFEQASFVKGMLLPEREEKND